MVFRPIDLYVITSTFFTFFTFFFKIQKCDFLRFLPCFIRFLKLYIHIHIHIHNYDVHGLITLRNAIERTRYVKSRRTGLSMVKQTQCRRRSINGGKMILSLRSTLENDYATGVNQQLSDVGTDSRTPWPRRRYCVRLPSRCSADLMRRCTGRWLAVPKLETKSVDGRSRRSRRTPSSFLRRKCPNPRSVNALQALREVARALTARRVAIGCKHHTHAK